MIFLGKHNRLRAVRQTDNGVYLTDREGTREVLLPNKFIPEEGLEEGQYLKVFIFKDSEDRITATTAEPLIKLNEFACLQVREVNEVGAFLDWGLEKDLLVPYKEQPGRMVVGGWYMAYLYLDADTERLVASCRYQKFLEKEAFGLKQGQVVDVLIDDESDLGINVIVNQQFRGLIYENELFERVTRGDQKKGFIKTLRPDGKLDITLQRPGYGKVDDTAAKILAKLKENNGFLPFGDKSSPEEVTRVFGMSKKTFKMTLGKLFKEQKVRLEGEGIYLLPKVRK
ncbi:MAG: GntR family transcriptional regulator [Saprospiraceae bacterium]|nr:GntR family transcriptional regulator [Saprospiraceae bacterium]